MERTGLAITIILAVAGILFVNSTMAATRTFDANYAMEWHHTADNITITLMANHSGWIGFGFSPTGGMLGADILLAFSNGNGSVTLQDRHAVGNFLPIMDAKQNYVLLSGSRNGGHLRVTFVRRLDTCDRDDAVIEPYTTKVIYAYGSFDAAGTPTYHGSRRGVISVLLLNTEAPAIESEEIFYIDPVPAPIILPDDATTYWCSLVRLPEIGAKSHIIGMEPVITSNNTDIVHHIVIYGCANPNVMVASYNYLTSDSGGNNERCATLLGIWAVGADEYRFPSDAGLPIGGDHGPNFVLIQTHYNNFMRQRGRVDVSRIRFIATTQLRKYDAGIIQSGIIQGIFVPPNVPSFNVAGYCSQNCLTQENIRTEGINIFAVGLHSHLLGRSMTLRHLRPWHDLEFQSIASDPYYDFKYQAIRSLKEYVNVKPGDILQTICKMNSSERNVPTLGGFSTLQEMCLSYVFYYPRTNMTYCQTSPLFAFTNDVSFYNLIGSNPSLFDWQLGYYNGRDSVNWTANVSAAVESKFFDTSIAYCNGNSPLVNFWSPPEVAKTSLFQSNVSNPNCQMLSSTNGSVTLTPKWTTFVDKAIVTTVGRDTTANTTFVKFQLSFFFSNRAFMATSSAIALVVACKLALLVN